MHIFALVIVYNVRVNMMTDHKMVLILCRFGSCFFSGVILLYPENERIISYDKRTRVKLVFIVKSGLKLKLLVIKYVKCGGKLKKKFVN